MTTPTTRPARDGARAPRAWPRFLTARVAADYCDTSRWTIRRHVPPCGRRGRTLIFAIEDVERWMRGEAIVPAQASSLDRIRALARAGILSLQRGDGLDGGAMGQ